MGNTTSQNVVKLVNEVTNSAITKVIQDNHADVAMTNSIVLDDGCVGPNGLIVVSGVNQTNRFSVNITAVQEALVDTKFTNDVTNKMQQMAKAISQQLNFNPGQTNASNLAEAMTELSNSIKNDFRQNCATKLMGSNTITCKGTGARGVYLTDISQSNIASVVRTCVQSSSATTDIENKIQNIVRQSALAKQESLFGPLAQMIAIIMGAVVLGLVFGGKSTADVLRSPWPWGTVLAGGGAYLGVAAFTKSGPFAAKADPDDDTS
jgi:hypothetical protein